MKNEYTQQEIFTDIKIKQTSKRRTMNRLYNLTQISYIISTASSCLIVKALSVKNKVNHNNYPVIYHEDYKQLGVLAQEAKMVTDN